MYILKDSFVLDLADPEDEPDPEAQHSASSSSDEDDHQLFMMNFVEKLRRHKIFYDEFCRKVASTNSRNRRLRIWGS